MAKYSKKHQLSEKSKDDAMKIARGTQKPGQTKEQTKLIAQGIQKGIEIYNLGRAAYRPSRALVRRTDELLARPGVLKEALSVWNVDCILPRDVFFYRAHAPETGDVLLSGRRRC